MKVQEINGIKINKIIKDDIKENLLVKSTFTLYDLFTLLQKYLSTEDIMKLLNIGKTSYYNYYKNKKSKYVERKLYDFFLLLDLDWWDMQ